LGEHTNVFGSGVYLNPLAEQFGFKFRFDVLFDIERKFEQVYTPPKLLPHPIVQNMPPFLFAVSCSIEPDSFFAEKVILGSGLKSLDIDYHAQNFYPPVKDAVNMDFGAFVQTMAVKAGKGRVVAFTDSTVFSNFSAFIPGKPELMLGTMDWLNRENQFSWLNPFFLFLAIISFAAAFFLLRKSSKDLRFISVVVIVAVCMIGIGIASFTAINRATYPLPEPQTKPTQVYFEKEHGNYELPLLGFTQDYKTSYAVFYQWVLRLGYFPGVGPSLQDATERGDLVVIVNPQGEFTQQEIATAKEYVSRGSKILLLDDPTNSGSSANSLLQAFGMRAAPMAQAAYQTIHDASGKNFWPIGDNYITAVEGGKPLLFTEGGQAVLAVTKQGEGTLAVMTLASKFVDSQMGGEEGVEPDERLLRIFNLEFSLLRGLINDNLETELAGGAGNQ
jgi:hypothetical protein